MLILNFFLQIHVIMLTVVMVAALLIVTRQSVRVHLVTCSSMVNVKTSTNVWSDHAIVQPSVQIIREALHVLVLAI